MSASNRPTRAPLAASARARLTLTVVLPTPPLPLAIASVWPIDGSLPGMRTHSLFQLYSGRITAPPVLIAVLPGFSGGEDLRARVENRAVAVRIPFAGPGSGRILEQPVI